MKISRENVLYVAELAHLALSDAEVDTYQKQLDAILTYIDKLNELDTARVEPMAQVLYSSDGTEDSTLREDTVRPCDVGEEILDQAPDPKKPYFRVPKVIER
jgi:aspartyl-tRNA(Asn)/glutamyl-tRNA(Gln) amidotransferase subunit C